MTGQQRLSALRWALLMVRTGAVCSCVGLSTRRLGVLSSPFRMRVSHKAQICTLTRVGLLVRIGPEGTDVVNADRLSGLWGAQTPLGLYLQENDITTLFFGGVNADQCVVNTFPSINPSRHFTDVLIHTLDLVQYSH